MNSKDLPYVLVVEDNEDLINLYLDTLVDPEYHLFGATSLEQALEKMRTQEFGVILTDLNLLGAGIEGGFEVLRAATRINRATRIIIVTAWSSRENALRATNEGAAGFLFKSDIEDPQDLVVTIKGYLREYELLKAHTNRQQPKLEAQPAPSDVLDDQIVIIGNGKRIQQVQKRINEAAKTDHPVLIFGERGTGKDLVSQSIYYNSHRNGKPYRRFHALELRRLQERALISLLALRGGTLFLDNLHALNEVTAALAIEMFRRCKLLDIRIIASSQIAPVALDDFLESLDPGLSMAEVFNSDSVAIGIPALHERESDDVITLAGYFLRQYTDQVVGFDEAAQDLIAKMTFRTANVSELRSLIRSTADYVIEEGGDKIEVHHIKHQISQLLDILGNVEVKQIFVSYSSKDRPFVRRFIKDLDSEYLDFWIDFERILPAAPAWYQEIQAALETSDAMLLIASSNSMKSKEVSAEWNYFLENNRPILVLEYDKADIPYRLKPIQRITYIEETCEDIQRLVVHTLEQL